MPDEQHLYRVEWPRLRRHLYRVCLGQYRQLLLDQLCRCAGPVSDDVTSAVESWVQAILTDLARQAQVPDAWPGWAALLPLFGNMVRLSRDLGREAEAICQAEAHGDSSHLWNVLHAYFTDERDALDGGGTWRVPIWRRLDHLRRELTARRQQQGGGEYTDLAELVAELLLLIEERKEPDVPRTVEGLLAYFYAFDPIYTQPFEEERQGIDTLEELTDLGWFDVQRAFMALPVELRQALEIRLGLRVQPLGYSPRTLRDRAERAIQRLRQALTL
ncbi:MAG: hypothetical protein FJZ47_19445 [Candidatus Tectomicrobia bacterium]|uniref:Uncharacterized protein n=1 Tax=Tectimicrobiota bacterium TaxID=2528274 RepID=A0A937W6E1_UNCTE|nr:hypothetical protein [Candidatus Tectomicrobia bacterium]